MTDKKKDYSSAANKRIRERMEEEKAQGIRRGKWAWGDTDKAAKIAMREKWIADKKAKKESNEVAPAMAPFSEISTDDLNAQAAKLVSDSKAAEDEMLGKKKKKKE